MDKKKCQGDDSCCAKVMADIARKEEKRLIHVLFLAGPLLIVCTWLVIVAIHLSIMRLLEKEALQIASHVNGDRRAFSEYALVLLNLFWSQLRKDLIILIAISLTGMALIISKAKLLSFPFRFKEIKKYKFLKEKL